MESSFQASKFTTALVTSAQTKMFKSALSKLYNVMQSLQGLRNLLKPLELATFQGSSK